jgi:tripartite-type tricarboxylate transporter receptor subunit TctC
MRIVQAGLRAAALSMSLIVGNLAWADTWPQRPVRLITPGVPGSGLDTLCRVLAERLTPTLGQPVVPDLRPGGSGTIAVDALLRAEPDGHTLMVSTNGLVSELPHVLNLRFDPLQDLKPVAELARSALVLVGGPVNAPRDLQALIASVKARPGTYSYASYSQGSISHFAGLMLNRLAGIDLLHIPYKGTTPALGDVMSGRVDLMFDALINSTPLVRAGRLKAYAVTSAQRSAFLPQVPTFRELGYDDLVADGWIGLFASERVPAALAHRIRMEFLVALAAPQVSERLHQLYFDASPPSTQRELEADLRTRHRRIGALVRHYAIRPE